jgi:hypothetical protein
MLMRRLSIVVTIMDFIGATYTPSHGGEETEV